MKQLKDVLHYYYPYNLKIVISHRTQPDFETTLKLPYLSDCTGVKPLLIPLSKLTEEIDHGGEKFVPKNVIVNWYMLPLWWDNGDAKPSDINSIPFYVIKLLLKWHFDIFGLIESNQAIEKQ